MPCNRPGTINAGSNAEHRMFPCPPKYTNKNVNIMPSQLHATQTPRQLLSSQLLIVDLNETYLTSFKEKIVFNPPIVLSWQMHKMKTLYPLHLMIKPNRIK